MSNNPNPFSADRDSNAADAPFDDDNDPDFAANALGAVQLPTAGEDRQSREAPQRFRYPTPQPGGRLY
jgi:hypothetical protein